MKSLAVYLNEDCLRFNLVAHGGRFEVGTLHEASDRRISLGEMRSYREHGGIFHEGYHGRSSENREVAATYSLSRKVLDYYKLASIAQAWF